MENIYRLKKRMVYPEKLTLDRVVKKPSSATSWCSEPLEAVTYSSTNAVENGSARNRSSQNDERPSSTTRQFIRERIRYLRDLVSLLPLDILYFYFGPDMVILRIPRMVKLHTFWGFFVNVDRILASPHMVRILRTLMYMMYLIHLNACAYYAFSVWEGLGSNDFVFNGKGNAYIVCFYFATKTATSIGKNPKPKKEIEFMFMTFSWLMGVFVFALLIGQIRDIIATATRSQTEYRKLVDETLEYLRRLNMPPDLMRRVQMWFTFTWATQHTLDENSIMDCLPHKMKTDIAIKVHIQTLNKVKLFADCDEALLRELVLKLRSVIYLPGDMICHKGDVGHEMYILQSGQVEVLGAEDSQVLATLTEGSVFGEISLLGISGMNRRTADVRSKGYSNLFVLNKTELNEALIHYPDAQDILNKKAKALMRKNASLERARTKPVIVIDNPQPPRLLETVMQVVPPDSKTNKLLRYGSKGRPKSGKSVKGLIENCTPKIVAENLAETSFQCDVEVHREMS
ncbi:Cyclic nucleotide-gated ion channel subunit B [Carabus blaptoides fortunei]